MLMDYSDSAIKQAGSPTMPLTHIWEMINLNLGWESGHSD
jgi:hypothetical protein